MNQNELDELIFNISNGWEVWEYRGANQYQKVYTYQPIQDTSCSPFDVGDSDEDGLSDVCVRLFFKRLERDFYGSALLESKYPDSFPSSVVWFDSAIYILKFTDIDGDGKVELFSIWCEGHPEEHGEKVKGVRLYENRGDNSYTQVFTSYSNNNGYGFPYVFGDFDGDDRKEWFEAGSASDTTLIWECIGDDDYKQVWGEHRKWLNINDAWLGNDTDGDGRPEIFVKNRWFGGPAGFALSMYEATGDNAYEFIPIDTIWRDVGFSSGKSCCGDVDKDGREEVVVSIGAFVIIYKAVGDNKYEKVWEWENDGSPYSSRLAITACHDFNKNGYDEIIISGDGETSIFEIDTAYGIASNPLIFKSCNLSISPNPIKGIADIRYEIPERGPISLQVYDATGRLVRTLTITQSQEPRAYTVVWNGKDDKGKLLPSGIYFCELRAGGYKATKKIILAR